LNWKGQQEVPVKVNMVWLRMSGYDGKLPGAVTDIGCRDVIAVVR
jgi:hypothetical protein